MNFYFPFFDAEKPLGEPVDMNLNVSTRKLGETFFSTTLAFFLKDVLEKAPQGPMYALYTIQTERPNSREDSNVTALRLGQQTDEEELQSA